MNTTDMSDGDPGDEQREGGWTDGLIKAFIARNVTVDSVSRAFDVTTATAAELRQKAFTLFGIDP